MYRGPWTSPARVEPRKCLSSTTGYSSYSLLALSRETGPPQSFRAPPSTNFFAVESARVDDAADAIDLVSRVGRLPHSPVESVAVMTRLVTSKARCSETKECDRVGVRLAFAQGIQGAVAYMAVLE